MKFAFVAAFLALAANAVKLEFPWNKLSLEEEGFDHLQQSIVRIETVSANFDWFRPFSIPEGSVSLGSGFIVQVEPYILIATNHHVIQDATNVHIQLLIVSEKKWPVDIVSACSKFDLALLTLKDDEAFRKELSEAGVTPQKLELSDKVAQMGEDVVALGFPLGQNSLKISKGNVAGNERVSNNICIQSTAPISPGNSGGPLLDGAGQKVVGVNFAGATGGENNNFVIPAFRVKAMIALHHKEQPEVPKEGEWKRLGFKTPEHGMMTVSPNEALYNFTHGCQEGIYIGKVNPTGFMSKAKPAIQAQSMLVSVEGKSLDEFGKVEIPELMSGKAALDDLFFLQDDLTKEVSFKTCRHGKIVEHSVSTMWTKDFDKGIVYVDEPITEGFADKFEIFGDVGVMEMTQNHVIEAFQRSPSPSIARWLLQEYSVKPRLMIVYVRPGSYASEIMSEGASVEKVNGQEVRDLKEWRKALIPEGNTNSSIWTLQTDMGVRFAVPFEATLVEQINASLDLPHLFTEGIKQVGLKLGFVESDSEEATTSTPDEAANESTNESANESANESVDSGIGNKKCPCVGIANIEGSTDVNIGGQNLSYPADLGARCMAWDDGRHVDCVEGAEPGEGNGWCAQSWCFVDPCNCDIDTPPKEVPSKGSYFPEAIFQGKRLWYSYATCGDKDERLSEEEQKEQAEKPKVCDENNTADEKIWGAQDCRCIGIAGLPGHINVTIQDKIIPFPGDTGAKCDAWDLDRYPDCVGESDDVPDWCYSKWCFVDPCSCHGVQPPQLAAFMPDAATHQGHEVFYSYEACGYKDPFANVVDSGSCRSQREETKCKEADSCYWTGARCVEKELLDSCPDKEWSAADFNGSLVIPAEEDEVAKNETASTSNETKAENSSMKNETEDANKVSENETASKSNETKAENSSMKNETEDANKAETKNKKDSWFPWWTSEDEEEEDGEKTKVAKNETASTSNETKAENSSMKNKTEDANKEVNGYSEEAIDKLEESAEAAEANAKAAKRAAKTAKNAAEALDDAMDDAEAAKRAKKTAKKAAEALDDAVDDAEAAEDAAETDKQAAKKAAESAEEAQAEAEEKAAEAEKSMEEMKKALEKADMEDDAEAATTKEKKEQTTEKKAEGTTDKKEEETTDKKKEEETTEMKKEEAATDKKQEETTEKKKKKEEEETTEKKKEEETTEKKDEAATDKKQEETTEKKAKEDGATDKKQEETTEKKEKEEEATEKKEEETKLARKKVSLVQESMKTRVHQIRPRGQTVRAAGPMEVYRTHPALGLVTRGSKAAEELVLAMGSSPLPM